MTEVEKLKRKLARLQAKMDELTAERDLAEMMALDLAPSTAIAYIERHFPTVIAGWRKRNPAPEQVASSPSEYGGLA